MEIPFNKIKVFINSATFRKKTPKKFDLVHSFVFGGDANPQETGKVQVAAKVDNEKTVVPINKSIMLSVTRKKGLSLKMRKAKIDFVLVQKGIFKDKKIGKCQLKLSNLVGEVDLEKKLKIENNNNVIGEIEVVASVNVPFGKLKLTNVGFKFCVVRRSENLKKMGGEKFAKVKISGEKILSEKSKIDNGENLKDLGILEERDEIDHNILGGKAKINEKISPLMINDPLKFFLTKFKKINKKNIK
ncbi:hypothetical protein MHBO_003721 [Bonamia ostreae]|uniref:Uncharacterized protein n=1 Tax=Bonamia ostreae TaxID=126728 RepID=A0ABV2ARA9_9EUKA